jgi:hypothetical protein
VQVRNPWGREEWAGLWAPGSHMWRLHPVTARTLGMTPDDAAGPRAAGHVAGGGVWLAFEELTRVMNRLYLCRPVPPDWHQLCLPAALGLEPDPYGTGGPPDSPLWFTNPQVRPAPQRAACCCLLLPRAGQLAA